VNIVSGAGETGAAVINHPLTSKVAFTGSTEVGKIIMRSLAGTEKKMTMELGGKAANIVFDDAPLDQAVEGIVNGIFFNQGHVCCAGSRLLVQESIADEVLAKLKRRIATLRVGDPMDKNTDLGAINSAEQLAKITDLVKAASRKARRSTTTAASCRRRASTSVPRSSPASA
jgi:aldehyde dehydrogenase (NAD+)